MPIDNNVTENAIRPFVVGRNYAHLAIMRSCVPAALLTL
ncbi:MAG: transposase [Chromatiaceae bacterium]